MADLRYFMGAMNGLRPLLLDSPVDEWKMDGVPSYRVEQVRNWVFEKGILDWEEMTNLPAHPFGRK